MNFLKFLAFLGIIAGTYFGFFRDNYIAYPIDLSLANVDGQVLSIHLLGRSDRFVQFRRHGVDRVFKYPISELSVVSKVKVIFLPNIRYIDLEEIPQGESGSSTSELHQQGMEQEIAELHLQLQLLDFKLESKPNPTEKKHVRHEIKILENKVDVLKYKMAVHAERSL